MIVNITQNLKVLIRKNTYIHLERKFVWEPARGFQLEGGVDKMTMFSRWQRPSWHINVFFLPLSLQ